MMQGIYEAAILPIERVVESIFSLLTGRCDFFGIFGAVVGVSLAVNLLALPLYNIADVLQLRERDFQRSLAPRLSRIRAAFSGDERFLRLSTFYREFHYHPVQALRSTLPILIELPFFIAAYHFLSNCSTLKGASWWIFGDLGSPDGLLHFGGMSLNVLPVLMTAVNVVSSAVYLRGATFREKLQTYALALIFLLLLYNSPSGLVLYWICNNIFSLVKNIVKSTKSSAKIFHLAMSAGMLVLTVVALAFDEFKAKYDAILVAATLAVIFAPLLSRVFNVVLDKMFAKMGERAVAAGFVAAAASMWALLGIYLPASLVATSPVEFSFVGGSDSPIFFIAHSASFYFGACVLWPSLIFALFSGHVRKAMAAAFSVVSILTLCNVTIFAHNYGDISIFCTLSDPSVLKDKSSVFTIWPLAAFFAAIALVAILHRKAKYVPPALLFTSMAAILAGIGLAKCGKISAAFSRYAVQVAERTTDNSAKPVEPIYHFSATEKNVFVIFIDRAVSAFFPRIAEKNPEVAEAFRDFTYFPNTISAAWHTTKGAPPMLGGYEYLPEKINERQDEFLRDKHNEASFVMPKLFSDAGFAVTVTDPVLPNYSWNGDLSAFKSHPEWNVSEIASRFNMRFIKEFDKTGGESEKVALAAIRSFSFLQCLPPFFRASFYTLDYFRPDSGEMGASNAFLSNYSRLYYAPDAMAFDSETPTFTFLGNDITHDSTRLSKNYGCFCDGDANFDEPEVYQVNAAALLLISRCFEKMKAASAWDNTRVIVVSDHGSNIDDFADFHAPQINSAFNPLFLFKDFGSRRDSYSVDNSFMCNADAPLLAKEGLAVSDENPFTGKKMTADKADGVKAWKSSGFDNNPERSRNKKTFTLNDGFLVKDDIFNPANWIPLGDGSAQ